MKITLALSRARTRWTVNFENACASEYLSSHCSIDHQTLADTMHARPLGERVAENGRTLHVPLNEHSIYTMHLSFIIYLPNNPFSYLYTKLLSRIRLFILRDIEPWSGKFHVI